jgi:hypothetical protein
MDPRQDPQERWRPAAGLTLCLLLWLLLLLLPLPLLLLLLLQLTLFLLSLLLLTLLLLLYPAQAPVVLLQQQTTPHWSGQVYLSQSQLLRHTGA